MNKASVSEKSSAYQEKVEKKPNEPKAPLKTWSMKLLHPDHSILTYLRNPEDIVSLYVGPDEKAKPMNIHKEVACYYSPVFRAAFNSQFKEGETQTYVLDDVDPGIAKIMIHWMYHQEISINPIEIQEKPAADLLLCKLWVLADRLLISSLQNVVIRKIEAHRNWFFTTSTDCLDYIYQKTTPESPLRRLYVEYCAFHVSSERYDSRPEDFPKEALIDIVKLLTAEITPHRRKQVLADRKMEDFEVDEMDGE